MHAGRFRDRNGLTGDIRFTDTGIPLLDNAINRNNFAWLHNYTHPHINRFCWHIEQAFLLPDMSNEEEVTRIPPDLS